MSRVLPPTPSVEHLRKEAKATLKAHRRGDPSVCATLRRLYHLADLDDDAILAADVTLTAVQFALAMDYGYRTWGALLDEVGARLGNDATLDAEASVSDDQRFSPVAVQRDGERHWLAPIPRYPLTVRRVDDEGTLQRYEIDRAGNGRLEGNLYCAARMVGAAVSWPELSCASGAAFAFAFEPHWAQDAEFITPVDGYAQACEILGIGYRAVADTDARAALAAIDEGLARGRPAVVNGWGGRFGHVVVGREPQGYRVIGGVPFADSDAPYLDAVDAPLGQRPPARLEIDDCPPRPVPAGDWYGAMLNPEQVSRNPAFLVDGYVNLPESERIRATLAAAAPMNEPRTLARTNLEHRQGGIAKGPPGHDGWKYTFSPWEGAFTMGSAGLRAWADLVASMDQPSDNFELVHGIDTTFGGMLSFRARTVVAWLRWAEPRVSPAARQGLARARAAFTEIARVNNEALGLVRTVPCYIDAPPPERTRADLEAMIAGQPALLYMITGEERALLGARAEASRGSPWGYRLLPGRETFEAARDVVPARLRRLAEVRDEAFSALEAAARRM